MVRTRDGEGVRFVGPKVHAPLRHVSHLDEQTVGVGPDDGQQLSVGNNAAVDAVRCDEGCRLTADDVSVGGDCPVFGDLEPQGRSSYSVGAVKA